MLINFAGKRQIAYLILIWMVCQNINDFFFQENVGLWRLLLDLFLFPFFGPLLLQFLRILL